MSARRGWQEPKAMSTLRHSSTRGSPGRAALCHGQLRAVENTVSFRAGRAAEVARGTEAGGGSRERIDGGDSSSGGGTRRTAGSTEGRLEGQRKIQGSLTSRGIGTRAGRLRDARD